MCISCRRHVDVHKRGREVKLMWTHFDKGGGQKPRFSFQRHKWMTLIMVMVVMRRMKRRGELQRGSTTFCSTTIRLRTFRLRHFVYDTSYTDISSTDISSTTVYQRVGQLYIQLLFQQIIIFINSNFYLHYDSFLSIPLPLTLC